MYKRDHHNAIAKVLAAFNADLFQEVECFFGGGTAIVLLLDEYRISADIDFLCSSERGYRRLRELTFGGRFAPLLKPGARIQLLVKFGLTSMGSAPGSVWTERKSSSKFFGKAASP